MGVRLAPLGEGEKLIFRADKPTLVAPLDAGIAHIAWREQAAIADRAQVAIVPRGVRARIEAKSPIAHVLFLSVSKDLEAILVRTYKGEIDRARLERHLEEAQILPRTNWLNELCHRYLFERAVCKKKDNDATRFLETEIAKEVYFLAEERATAKDRASMVEKESALVARALKRIESRLFEPDVVADLAEACDASESTLLRAFKREIGRGPKAYVRARRLDESMLLLKSRRHSVSEVAIMVGYRNFAAFSAAFRGRFGIRPSEVKRGPSRTADHARETAGDVPRTRERAT